MYFVSLIQSICFLFFQHVSVPEISVGLGPGADGRLHTGVPL